MIRNPCKKCVVKVMCSQKCDDIRKWNNLKRIWKSTFFTTIRAIGVAMTGITIFIFIVIIIGITKG
jgi:hypothetical protein